MIVWFRFRIYVIFVCFKKPLMTVSRQWLREIPKSNVFLLVPTENLNTENKCQKASSHDRIKTFRGNFVDGLTGMGLEIWLQEYNARVTSLTVRYTMNKADKLHL